MPLAETLLTGAVAGGVYSLLALGLALQYGVSRVLNLAYGEAVALAAICSALLYQEVGAHPLLLLLGLPPLFALLHLVLHRVLFLPLMGRALSLDSAREGRIILLTFGISFLVQGVMAAELGGRLFSYSFLSQGLALGSSTIALNRLLAFGLACVLVLFTHLFLWCTRIGRAVRALSREPEEALLVGVPVARLAAWTFALGGGVAAAAGVLLSMYQTFTTASGPELTLKALAVVVLGGVGGAPGALVGGVTLGIMEALVTRFLSPGLSMLAVYALFVLGILYLRGQREEVRP